MRALLHGRDVVGMPVVEISTGDAIADVRDVVFDPVAGAVTGFTLAKRTFWHGRLASVLPMERVASVGTSAVMVADARAVTAPDDAPDEMRGADAGNDVLDDMVVTASGRQLGRVVDVIVVGGSQARVVGFQISGGSVGEGLIPIGAHEGLSGSALVVPDEYEARIRTDLTGLSAELADLDRGPS
jgi:uncharacterized protein YrrD